MPNWCRNNLVVNSDEPHLISRFTKALDTNGLFQALSPNPTNIWDYSWSVENWGTKWDVSGNDIQIVQIDEDRIIIEFDTAWGPPIAFYKTLENLGFEVTAMYHEEGMAFCGIYTDGEDDFYEYGEMTHEEIRAVLPDELDECFAISEMVEERMQDEE